MAETTRFDSPDPIAWCPGCGNHGLLEAMKQALAELDLEPHEVLICSGIGQAAKLPHYLWANGFNGLHGRAVPPAFGAKVANKDLTVIVSTGDGDSYGEGGNHLLHHMRRNVDIAHFVHDNMIYGLTKGQASPTTGKGHTTGVQTQGVILEPFRPLAMAMAMGATFIARGFTGEKAQLTALMKEAIQHRGYALVDILQPCVVFNQVNTFQWFRQHTESLPDSYDPWDREAAMYQINRETDRLALGVLYREEKPTYEDQVPVLKDRPPLVDKELKPERVRPLFDQFR